MALFKKFLYSLVLVILFCGSLSAKISLIANNESDIEVDFWGFFKPEFFYGDRFIFLNKNVPQDKSFYFRHTNDYFLDCVYGKQKFGCPVAEFKTSVRNRAVWGSPSSIAQTLSAESPLLNANIKDHNHAFPRLLFWMREAWLQLDVAQLLHLDMQGSHTLTVGAFPFELGRGIALGAAYALGPGPLGFYSDAMIDQYAFGIKISGDIVCDVLSYDLYGSILQSKSNSFNETNKPIYRHEIGRQENPARGFGKDNYLIAGRLIWTALDSELGQVTLEPYVLYNNDPEQKIEFVADAESKLGTVGLAGEYIGKKLEFGFDAAYNFGRQFVRPWDRNQIIVENINGKIALVNNHVLIVSENQFDGTKAIDIPKSAAQTAIIDSALTATSLQNDALIEGAQNLPGLGTIPGPLSLQNSPHRFRADGGKGYSNTYHGFMIVGDASYWLYKKEFQVAFTAGMASGDKDPNNEVKDGTFGGFIGLQEVYAGKRVKSVFLLGTVGKVKRPGATPENGLANRDFAASTTGFTNLRFLGMGSTWKPSSCDTRFVWNPNLFVYWEDKSGFKYDPLAKKDTSIPANPFLGVEVNSFLSWYPFESLKCFAIGSIFIPGQHFTDIKGKPLDAAQKKALEFATKKGTDLKLLPNIGDDISYTINVGMEFAF